jgi:hypothetical protein
MRIGSCCTVAAAGVLGMAVADTSVDDEVDRRRRAMTVHTDRGPVRRDGRSAPRPDVLADGPDGHPPGGRTDP